MRVTDAAPRSGPVRTAAFCAVLAVASSGAPAQTGGEGSGAGMTLALTATGLRDYYCTVTLTLDDRGDEPVAEVNGHLVSEVGGERVAGAVGAAVAVSGGIGFVGIVVPHVLRLLIGPGHRFLLPASALLGAVLLLAADVVSRSVVAPAELPIGIVTATIGGPFFLWILLRRRGVLDL